MHLYSTLLFINLCSVFCADSGTFIIEKPDEPARLSDNFQVFWNVPSIQCRSKGLPFPDLKTKYGIMQNTGDRFQGEHITILYDPGKFPALLQNGSSTYRRNGGVPQEGDLELHLQSFAKNVHAMPKNFSGIGVIDFESWRPIFRQNFGSLQPYKELSYEIEAKRHPIWWRKAWIQEEAVRRFEEAGRKMMLATLTLARELRPMARWGYYAYPYCFNMNPTTKKMQCPSVVLEENDRLSSIWTESTGLFPSIYSKKDLPPDLLQDMITGRLQEAKRARRNSIILPYFWYRYRDGGFLTARDFKSTLSTIYKSSAAGVILWGSSDDVNTKAKCQDLLDYVEKILGPAVAKYTTNARRYRKHQDKDGLEVIDVDETIDNTALQNHDIITIIEDEIVEDKTNINIIDNQITNASDENKTKLDKNESTEEETDKTNIDNQITKASDENKTKLDKNVTLEVDKDINETVSDKANTSQTEKSSMLSNDTAAIESVNNKKIVTIAAAAQPDNKGNNHPRNDTAQMVSSATSHRDLGIIIIIIGIGTSCRLSV